MNADLQSQNEYLLQENTRLHTEKKILEEANQKLKELNQELRKDNEYLEQDLREANKDIPYNGVIINKKIYPCDLQYDPLETLQINKKTTLLQKANLLAQTFESRYCPTTSIVDLLADLNRTLKRARGGQINLSFTIYVNYLDVISGAKNSLLEHLETTIQQLEELKLQKQKNQSLKKYSKLKEELLALKESGVDIQEFLETEKESKPLPTITPMNVN